MENNLNIEITDISDNRMNFERNNDVSFQKPETDEESKSDVTNECKLHRESF